MREFDQIPVLPMTERELLERELVEARKSEAGGFPTLADYRSARLHDAARTLADHIISEREADDASAR